MKKFNLKEKFLRIALATVTVGMIFGAVFSAAMQTEAATDPTGVVETTAGKVLFADQLFEEIGDPVEVRTDKGVYYAPSDYIYYGSDVNGNPLLWRVLDADADNTGREGAIFLFSEKIVEDHVYFSQTDDDTIYQYYNLIEEIYGNGSDLHFNSFYNSGKFEYTYQFSHMAKNEWGIRSFIPQSVYGDYYATTYLKADVKKNYDLDVYEMSAIRPVTKTDALTGNGFGMNDVEGDMYWTVDTVYGKDGVPYAGAILNNSYIFPLSVDELEKYVATYSGAPGLATTTSTEEEIKGWWLRTSYNTPLTVWTDNLNERKYIFAGYIDGDGNVNIEDVNNTNLGGRFGVNLEKDRVVYGEMVGDNEWRLGIMEPFYYNNQNKQFDAWIERVEHTNPEDEGNPRRDIQFTIGYKNAIGRDRFTYYDTNALEEFISIMIKDKDGNIKYYGTVDVTDTVENYNDLTFGDGEAVFNIPAEVDFNEVHGDKMVVFWERKSDDPHKTSFTSNMVELECAHSYFRDANCVTPAICLICESEMGTPDLSNHQYSKPFSGTPENPQHGYMCWAQDCPMYGQIVYAEDCVVEANCVEVFKACSCGNKFFNEDAHVFERTDDPDYVVTGYCEHSNEHFMPASIDISGNYVIENVANFLWLGEQINKGNTFEGKKIEIYAQVLDFSELEERGLKYFDFGSDFTDHCFKGTLDGNGVIIKNLTIDSSGQSGLFAYTNGATIRDIIFENVKITGGSNAGIVVSMADDTRIENIEIVALNEGDIEIDGNDNYDAAIVGYARGDTVIERCLVYGAIHGGVYESDKYGEYLPLIGYNYQNEAQIINSYYLADEANDNGGRTAEQMASGEIAYLLNWGQNLTGSRIDLCPRKGPAHTKVHKVPACGGVGDAYSNDADGREAHDINVFIEDDGFEWDGTLCYVTMGCTRCDYKARVTLSPENGGVEIVDHGGGVRYTFTATVEAENGVFTNDCEIFAKRIEDVTIVEPLVKDFDGQYVSADDFMTNTKMNYLDAQVPGKRDAIVYFVDSVTGEYVGKSVAKAGTYSLVVDGRNNYLKQKYVFKEILTINKITLNLDINVISKTTVDKGEPEFTFGFAETDRISLDWISVELSALPSNKIGDYLLDVTVTTRRGGKHYLENPYWVDDPYSQDEYFWDDPYYEYDMYIESIDLKWEKSVTATVLPQREVSIEIDDLWADNFIPANPDYYGDTDSYAFTYGDEIPYPTEENFIFDEESELTFQWYVKKYDNYWDYSLVRLSEKPSDVGEYVLRVIASATDNLVKNYIDVEFEITKKVLNVKFIIPEDAETVVYDYDTYYVFKIGEYPEFVIEGIDEEDWEALGISFEDWYRTEIDNSWRFNSGYPTEPGHYRIEVGLKVSVPFGGAENYEINDNDRINVYLDTPDSVVPVVGDHIYDGEVKDIEIIVPEGWTESDYTVTITKDGSTVTEIKEAGRYIVSVIDKNGVTNTATVNVRREIRIFVKERSIELSSDGYIPFDLMDLVFTAGYAPEIGHTLTDLQYEIDVENGKIRIVGWTVMAGDEDVSYLYTVVSDNGYGHGSGDMNVIHIYDNPCDSECNVCGLVRPVQRHKGGVATCSTQAICDICGEYYGKLDGRRHENESEIFVPSASDLMKHDLVYSCCGAIIRTESHSVDTAATCTEQATCAICRKDGYHFGPLDPDNHSSDEFTYKANASDAGKHDKHHACCGAYIETEEHSGGEANCVSGAICQYCSAEYTEKDPDVHANIEAHTAANCKEQAKCSECGESYGPLDPDNHESDAIVSVPSAKGDVHNIVHSCCGAVIDTEAHTGGVAVCNSGKICEKCGGEYGEKDPDNHASDEYECIADPSDSSRHIRSRACCGADASVEEHKGESVSCLEPVKCTECGFEYEEHGDHVYSDSCDNVCNVCDQPTRGKRFHLDENKDGKCDHCGAEVGENDIGFADDVHTDSESDGDDDDGCGASVGFGAVAILITTIGAGALFVKKKEN